MNPKPIASIDVDRSKNRMIAPKANPEYPVIGKRPPNEAASKTEPNVGGA